MKNTIVPEIRFLWSYVRLNWLATVEYRFSFLSQVLGMLINDVMWLIFWRMYFDRFPLVNGWQVQDVTLLWAIITVSFGVATGIFGNSLSLSDLVSQGQLDAYLTIPKNVLTHILVSKIRPTAIGDIIFGVAVFIGATHPSPKLILLFVSITLASAMVQLSFFILTGSIVFFLESSGDLTAQANASLIHVSSYPTSIFSHRVKIILYSLVPAGFIVGLPVQLMREFKWEPFVLLIFAGVFFSSLAWQVFFWGIKRYESSNLIQLRQ